MAVGGPVDARRVFLAWSAGGLAMAILIPDGAVVREPPTIAGV
jgi:hypothetical protein